MEPSDSRYRVPSWQIAPTTASSLQWKIPSLNRRIGGCRRKLQCREDERRERDGGDIVCECYLYRIEESFDFNPTPRAGATISLARFVSPATNKQRNEHGSISRHRRIASEPLQILDSASPDGNLSSSTPARYDLLLNSNRITISCPEMYFNYNRDPSERRTVLQYQ